MTLMHRTASSATLPALALVIAGAAACAPSQASSPAPPMVASGTPASTPVLLSCPVGQQPLLRQVTVNGVLVPQVECVVTAPIATAPAAAPVLAPPLVPAPGFAAPAVVPAAVALAPAPAAPPPTTLTVRRPVARRVVYDDVEEIRRPARRSWQKSALIIGSAAGVGAGVGAATGGKKGALIGAAVGGGAATLWDQVTRRQPR